MAARLSIRCKNSSLEGSSLKKHAWPKARSRMYMESLTRYLSEECRSRQDGHMIMVALGATWPWGSRIRLPCGILDYSQHLPPNWGVFPPARREERLGNAADFSLRLSRKTHRQRRHHFSSLWPPSLPNAREDRLGKLLDLGFSLLS